MKPWTPLDTSALPGSPDHLIEFRYSWGEMRYGYMEMEEFPEGRIVLYQHYRTPCPCEVCGGTLKVFMPRHDIPEEWREVSQRKQRELQREHSKSS